jgi:hypothetical protein
VIYTALAVAFLLFSVALGAARADLAQRPRTAVLVATAMVIAQFALLMSQ